MQAGGCGREDARSGESAPSARLRLLGFAFGLTFSFAFPLVFSPFLSPAQADCFAHWSYGMGEFMALVGVFTTWSRRSRPTVLVHGALTIAWAAAVSANCDLWAALWTGEPSMLHHPM